MSTEVDATNLGSDSWMGESNRENAMHSLDLPHLMSTEATRQNRAEMSDVDISHG